jgi:hypothetical protein
MTCAATSSPKWAAKLVRAAIAAAYWQSHPGADVVVVADNLDTLPLETLHEIKNAQSRHCIASDNVQYISIKSANCSY